MKGYSRQWLAICLLSIPAAQQPGLATAAADDKDSSPAASNTSMATSELAPAPAPALGQLTVALPTCELSMLTLLGQQQFYNASGYSITTELPDNLAPEAWQSLGCLKSVTNLTLTGSLPGLPDSWADSGCFPALQFMNLSNCQLTGSLPASWASPTAFPQLQVMNFSVTPLSGILPDAWAQNGSFAALAELRLTETNISGNCRTSIAIVHCIAAFGLQPEFEPTCFWLAHVLYA
ncbi:hypothetical protein ABBQ38_008519 [Trebouxia sp. C0009 RCD-2024]